MHWRRIIRVNGLAITDDFPNLVAYYHNNVIAGPGSFVIQARGFDDFKRAIRQKLWREFSSAIAVREIEYLRGDAVVLRGD